MWKIFFVFIALNTIIGCKNNENESSFKYAENNLTEEEIHNFKYSIIRYCGKLAGKADHFTKFDPQFDEYYRLLSLDHELIFHVQKSDKEYFLLTRTAPSIHNKKVAIGGYLIRDNEGNINEYFEEFRTWKMPVEELKEKSKLLFEKMVSNQDLTSYYTMNSSKTDYIEFPNEHVFFDKDQSIWVSTLENPLEDYYHLKANTDKHRQESQDSVN